jgi:hypothetical protein
MSTLKVTNIKAADGTDALTIADGTGVIGANKFTDLAGTGAPDFPNGLVLSSNATGGDISGVTLDDYEEGTWEMTLHDANSGGNQSDYSATGTYVKIGNLVKVTLNSSVTFTNYSGSPSSLTSTNAIYWSLPFTPSSTKKASGSIVTSQVSFRNGADACISPVIETSASRGRFLGYSSSDAPSLLRPVDFNGGSIQHLTLSYFVD